VGARARRRYYANRPHLQHRLSRPVISIGNLAAGGRAKTPLAALVATRLRDMGERPAILSRGYGRRDRRDGVVVVRDPDGIRADLDRAGDEPLMLARRLDGVSVLVCSSRYLAGRLAEHHFGSTVHVLDDGFQHFDLHRDADLVVIAASDVENPVTLPSGRLREPIDAATAADAFVALGADVRVGGCDRPTWIAHKRVAPANVSGPLLAVAGVADPLAFFRDARQAGWSIARELAFRDHHPYSADDVRRIEDEARAAGTATVLTTEKDYVRLLPFRPFGVSIVVAPLTLELEGIDTFDAWLRARVDAARRS
jgi:tetraacyldisaccharide 4'-kinase